MVGQVWAVLRGHTPGAPPKVPPGAPRGPRQWCAQISSSLCNFNLGETFNYIQLCRLLYICKIGCSIRNDCNGLP